jgi:hypothetical protein
MSRYAENTTVSSEASRGEIERTLQRYGADQFMYGWDQDQAVIGFRCEGRQVRFVLRMPARDDRTFTHHSRGARTPDAALKLWEQACRQRWRALSLVVKAKLEAVDAGISAFETEFLGHIVLPNGQTAGEWMAPQVEAAYATGAMPSDLPALGPGHAR